MNLQEVKSQLGLSQLNLNKSEDGEWFNHFDNDTRRSIGIHKDTVAKIQDGTPVNLGLKDSGKMVTKSGKNAGQEYNLIHIVAFTPTDLVL